MLQEDVSTEMERLETATPALQGQLKAVLAGHLDMSKENIQQIEAEIAHNCRRMASIERLWLGERAHEVGT